MRTVISLLATAEEGHHDISQTPSKFWPERYEIIFGSFASVLIFLLLYKFAGPAIKKGLAARTERIQGQLDAGTADRTAAEAEAAQIRTAKGDIAAERARIFAEAEAQALAIREAAASSLAAEISELEARAAADIEASAGRADSELRAEIARLSIAAVDHVVTGSLDDATQQELIESFIARVGAIREGASS